MTAAHRTPDFGVVYRGCFTASSPPRAAADRRRRANGCGSSCSWRLDEPSLAVEPGRELKGGYEEHTQDDQPLPEPHLPLGRNWLLPNAAAASPSLRSALLSAFLAPHPTSPRHRVLAPIVAFAGIIAQRGARYFALTDTASSVLVVWRQLPRGKRPCPVALAGRDGKRSLSAVATGRSTHPRLGSAVNGDKEEFPWDWET